MDLRRLAEVLVVVTVGLVTQLGCDVARANFLFRVQNKFAGRETSLDALKAHDAHRHARILSPVDLPLGVDSLLDAAGFDQTLRRMIGFGNKQDGLYYLETPRAILHKIGLGSPPKYYYVQVDTGSDILWVNCAGCTSCPKKSDLGIKLTLYDSNSSSTAKRVTCEDDFCSLTSISQAYTCQLGSPCEYTVAYGDGSSTSGYFVRDTVQLDQVTGNHQTRSINGSIVFGCGAKQSGQLGGSQSAVDGIIGFGQSNTSMISQIAAAGKVKRIFAHCLDNVNGGGIFAIGEVVSPKVKTAPMVPNQGHYNIVLREIEVGGTVLERPADAFDAGDNRGTIIDSGTALAYLPDVVYESMMNKVLTLQPGLKIQTVHKTFSCFQYSENVDDGFPVVTFHFEDSLSLAVYPHDYLFQFFEEMWCFGWQNAGMQIKDGTQLTLLGDLVLSNKLVLYDIESQVIGWTEYNCSSSIKVRDEVTGAIYSVGTHNLSRSSCLSVGRILTFLSILTVMLHSSAI